VKQVLPVPVEDSVAALQKMELFWSVASDTASIPEWKA